MVVDPEGEFSTVEIKEGLVARSLEDELDEEEVIEDRGVAEVVEGRLARRSLRLDTEFSKSPLDPELELLYEYE